MNTKHLCRLELHTRRAAARRSSTRQGDARVPVSFVAPHPRRGGARGAPSGTLPAWSPGSAYQRIVLPALVTRMGRKGLELAAVRLVSAPMRRTAPRSTTACAALRRPGSRGRPRDLRAARGARGEAGALGADHRATDPDTDRPVDRHAPTRRARGYSLRLAHYNRSGPDAIIVVTGGEFRSVRALIRDQRRLGFKRARSLRIRGHRGCAAHAAARAALSGQSRVVRGRGRLLDRLRHPEEDHARPPALRRARPRPPRARLDRLVERPGQQLRGFAFTTAHTIRRSGSSSRPAARSPAQRSQPPASGEATG